MRTFLRRWLAPLFLAMLFARPSLAQPPSQPQMAPRAGQSPAAQTPPEPSQEHPPPAFQYFVAVGLSVLVLFVVCKPSGKNNQ